MKFVNGERFPLDHDQTAKMKNIDFTVTNENVMKTIYGDPFDEFYDVYLTLTFQSEQGSVVLSKSSTGAWEEQSTCEWQGFRIELFSADVYHSGTVILEVNADAYESQESVDPDFQNILRKAKGGDPDAMFPLSEIYRKGDAGIDKDDSRALIWCRKAAEGGYAEAMCALGDRLIEGRGIQKIEGEGYWWYRNASRDDPAVIHRKAEKGNPVAMYYVGELLMGENKIGQALDWYRKASEMGVLRAVKKMEKIRNDNE